MRHIVTVEEVLPALDNEVLLASSCSVNNPIKKRLVFVPSLEAFSVRVIDDGTEIRTPFKSIDDAVAEYNSIFA